MTRLARDSIPAPFPQLVAWAVMKPTLSHLLGANSILAGPIVHVVYVLAPFASCSVAKPIVTQFDAAYT